MLSIIIDFFGLVLVLKIFQENLVIFVEKLTIITRKLKLLIFAGKFDDFCRKIFPIFGRKFNAFVEKCDDFCKKMLTIFP